MARRPRQVHGLVLPGDGGRARRGRRGRRARARSTRRPPPRPSRSRCTRSCRATRRAATPTARRSAGRATAFHGRSDEVLNVSGNGVGTEEIEAAVWAADSAAGGGEGLLRACAVVGAPDEDTGLTPIGFVVLDRAAADGAPAGAAGALSRLLGAARRAARVRLGSHAEPAQLLSVAALPKTPTGKVARKVLQRLLAGPPALPGGAAAEKDAAARARSPSRPCSTASRRVSTRGAAPRRGSRSA